MKEIRSDIEIRASVETVWQILTDFTKYPEWNPLIPRAIGTAEVGARVELTIPSGSKEKVLRCTVIKVEPNRELCWQYHILLPGLFRAKHSFTLEPMGIDRVRFVNREVFGGLYLPFQAKELDTQTRRVFQEMDKALKVRAEQL
ncbi:MAG: SRPBCC domain-containing protein [Coprothermobacterota bacterium]|nr:SRPBCC domain-containing protein [Coprothermobacterota bacterium]